MTWNQQILFAAGTLLPIFIVATYFLMRLQRYWILRWTETGEQFERQQKQDYSKAQRELEKLKREIVKANRGSMVIDLVHDLGEFRFERDNTSDHVNFEQAIDVMNHVRAARKDQPITVILHTLGGYSLAAELAAEALRSHSGPTKAFVPYIAMSAGTLIALGADEIVLGKHACLGPIDTQYEGRSFPALEELVNAKKEHASDQSLLTYFEARVREGSIRDRIRAILDDHHEERAIDALLRKDRAHDHRIKFDEAKICGLNVSKDMKRVVYEYIDRRMTMLKRYKDSIVHQMPAESEQTEDHAPSGV